MISNDRFRLSRRALFRLGSALVTGSVLSRASQAGPFDHAMKNPADPDLEKLQGRRIGLALGAGGANGLAHIMMLEVFDELGITPHRIAGSSIGAVIGALYASGNTAKDILQIVDNMILRENDSWRDALTHKGIFDWIDFVDPEIGKGGIISGNAFLNFLYGKIHLSKFSELKIPLSIVATDFWKREQVVMGSGDLLTAIQGSMAIPGLFTPVQHNGMVLVDGGLVNPVPYDLLYEDCDFVIAIDVTGEKSRKNEFSFMDAIFNTFQIMEQSILREKLAQRRPDIYIKPRLVDIRALEFQKIDQIFLQAQEAQKLLRRSLQNVMQA